MTPDDLRAAARTYLVDRAARRSSWCRGADHAGSPSSIRRARRRAAGRHGRGREPSAPRRRLKSRSASPASPFVAFNIWIRSGSSADPKGKEGLASLTASLIAGGSTTQDTAERILEKQYPLAAGYAVSVDKEMTNVTGRVHRDNLDGVLRAGSQRGALTRVRRGRLHPRQGAAPELSRAGAPLRAGRGVEQAAPLLDGLRGHAVPASGRRLRGFRAVDHAGRRARLLSRALPSRQRDGGRRRRLSRRLCRHRAPRPRHAARRPARRRRRQCQRRRRRVSRCCWSRRRPTRRRSPSGFRSACGAATPTSCRCSSPTRTSASTATRWGASTSDPRGARDELRQLLVHRGVSGGLRHPAAARERGAPQPAVRGVDPAGVTDRARERCTTARCSPSAPRDTRCRRSSNTG